MERRDLTDHALLLLIAKQSIITNLFVPFARTLLPARTLTHPCLRACPPSSFSVTQGKLCWAVRRLPVWLHVNETLLLALPIGHGSFQIGIPFDPPLGRNEHHLWSGLRSRHRPHVLQWRPCHQLHQPRGMYHSDCPLLRTEAQGPETHVQNLSQVEHRDGLHGLVVTRTLAVSILRYHFHSLTCAQSTNLAGYGRLPDGFVCAFVGGWLYAMPSMLSIFYASAIAINTQLVFVHKRTLRDQRQTLYLVVPPLVALFIGMHKPNSLYNSLSVSNTQMSSYARVDCRIVRL